MITISVWSRVTTLSSYFALWSRRHGFRDTTYDTSTTLDPMQHPVIQLAEVDASACQSAMVDGAMRLSWRAHGHGHPVVKEDCSFYLDLDPLYFGVIQSGDHFTRVVKKRIVGRPARYRFLLAEGAHGHAELTEPEVPCMWGDPMREAPALIESSDLSWRNQPRIFCVRLPVPVDGVDGFEEADFAITGEVASRIIREHIHKLQELSVGPLSCTDEVRCMITDFYQCNTGADCPALSVT